MKIIKILNNNLIFARDDAGHLLIYLSQLLDRGELGKGCQVTLQQKLTYRQFPELTGLGACYRGPSNLLCILPWKFAGWSTVYRSRRFFILNRFSLILSQLLFPANFTV